MTVLGLGLAGRLNGLDSRSRYIFDRFQLLALVIFPQYHVAEISATTACHSAVCSYEALPLVSLIIISITLVKHRFLRNAIIKSILSKMSCIHSSMVTENEHQMGLCTSTRH